MSATETRARHEWCDNMGEGWCALCGATSGDPGVDPDHCRPEADWGPIDTKVILQALDSAAITAVMAIEGGHVAGHADVVWSREAVQGLGGELPAGSVTVAENAGGLLVATYAGPSPGEPVEPPTLTGFSIGSKVFSDTGEGVGVVMAAPQRADIWVDPRLRAVATDFIDPGGQPRRGASWADAIPVIPLTPPCKGYTPTPEGKPGHCDRCGVKRERHGGAP